MFISLSQMILADKIRHTRMKIQIKGMANSKVNHEGRFNRKNHRKSSVGIRLINKLTQNAIEPITNQEGIIIKN